MKPGKIFCLFLAVVLTALAAFSCGEAETGGSGGSGNSDQGGGGGGGEGAVMSEDDLRAQHNPNFDPVDMQGYVFKFGTRDDSHAVHGGTPAHTRDLYAETETGDLINDAVYRRNMAIEEKYNCKIEMEAFPEDNENRANEIVERAVRAGDKSFDLLMTHMHLGTNSAVKGSFYDIAQFPNIDLTKPYWSDGATEGYSIGNRLFIGLSDLSFSTNENMYCMFFNKSLTMDYEVENPYALVRDNKWTFDKFNEIIRVGAVDLDGDGSMGDNDQYGYISTAAVNFLWSGGSHIMKKDENDIPVLDFMNQKTLDIYDKTLAIVKNEYTYSKEKEWHTGDTIGMFANGQGVFFGSQLCRVNNLRATEFDYGIVPYPKFNEAQERYYSYVDGHASMMAIPINLPNIDWTGLLIEEMSFLSYKDILPTYYDVVLNIKMVRDEESIETLKILFDSKVFDPSYVLGGDMWIMWNDNIQENRAEIVSAYERREPAFMRDMQRKIDALLALD